MNVVPFVANNAADALTQIRAALGPEAVVLNVRKLPASGWQALWQKARIEVLAYLPHAKAGKPQQPDENREPQSSDVSAPPGAAPLLDVLDAAPVATPLSLPAENDEPEPSMSMRFAMPRRQRGEWNSERILRSMGLPPVTIERVMQRLRDLHGPIAPEVLADELRLTRATMESFWRPGLPAGNTHVFVGPPGSGKTTALCKWLTQSVLLEGRSARVFRLDVPRANSAEALSVHCEILGVPLARSWDANDAVQPKGQANDPTETNLPPAALECIDLPGVEVADTPGLEAIGTLLQTVPRATVSLVLNAAYDLKLMEKQWRAFSALPIQHLIFTHLDEEPRWSKLWQFVLGTNYSLSFLSAGQNIPGQFLRAAPDLLFPPDWRAL